jgi:hypothetical protein
MRTTTQDIERIISGEPIPVGVDYPLDDQHEGFQWFMKQPSDWLMDMAHAVREAAEAKILAMPEVASVRDLPPSDTWMARQAYWKAYHNARITEIEAMEGRTPEDELELANTRDHVANLATPDGYNRALEIAASRTQSAFHNWLAPRLLADAKGNLICDPNTEAGRERWERLGSDTRDKVIVYVSHVLALVRRAKNFNASKPLNTN